MNLGVLNTTIFFLITMTAIPFILEAIAFILTLNYKRAAININKTDKEALRAIRLRYINSSKLGIPVENSKSFVSKSLYSKDNPLGRVLFMDRLGCLISCLNLICAAFFIIQNHSERSYPLLVMCLSFYIFRMACSLEQRCNHIVSIITDYLDNILAHRINPSKKEARRDNTSVIASASSPAINSTPTDNENHKPELKPTLQPALASVNMQANSDLIESVLQEFLP